MNVEPPTFSLVGESFINGDDFAFDVGEGMGPASGGATWNGGNGIIEGVSLLKGNFYK